MRPPRRAIAHRKRAAAASLLQTLAGVGSHIEQYNAAIDVFPQLADLDPDSGAAAPSRDHRNIPGSQGISEGGSRSAMRPTRNILTTRLCHHRAPSLFRLGQDRSGRRPRPRKLLDGKNDREVFIDLADIYEKAQELHRDGQGAGLRRRACEESSEEKQTMAFRRGAMYERHEELPRPLKPNSEKCWRSIPTMTPR